MGKGWGSMYMRGNVTNRRTRKGRRKKKRRKKRVVGWKKRNLLSILRVKLLESE